MTERKVRQSEWSGWIKAIILAFFLAFFLRTFIFSTSIVEGVSMDPALEDGERIIFNKLIYLFEEPKRGDIIIIKQGKRNYVKRLIGLPNETIEMTDHELFINGKKQTDSFVDRHAHLLTGSFGPIKIPDNSYFVMGDNRAVSKDSRNGLGFITRDQISGRSELIIYPFNHFELTR